MTGVPVIPLGLMFPQGSDDPSTGVPMCVLQRTAPFVSFRAYTESFSVATNTNPEYTRGSAYAAPSSFCEVQSAFAQVTKPEVKPARELLPWYVVQSTSGKFVDAQPLLEVDVVMVDVLVVEVLEEVFDELLLVVETFPGEDPNSAKAEIATTARTATARTAIRFTIRGISASSLKGSQVPCSRREAKPKC